MSSTPTMIDRREAIRRVSAMLGGVAFVGGTSLLTACEKSSVQVETLPAKFSAGDVAYLDEIAETILPATKTPGAKAAKTGAFMALMVTESYSAAEQRVFRDGMKKIDEASKKANGVAFMQATPEQRLRVLGAFDRQQKRAMDRREAADRTKKGLAPIRVDEVAGDAADAFLPDERKENVAGTEASGAAAITKDTPPHFFRMMKELALLGYFTSEVGCTQALRYVESPGRFEPCLPYTPGQPAWAPHA